MRATSKAHARTKPPEVRRDELIDSAQRLFLKHGVAATTIEQITSGAKVAKGTFYLYFFSKEDILAAMGDRFAETVLSKIKSAIAETPQHNWKTKLQAWSTSCATGYLDSIQLHDIAFLSSRRPTRKGLVDNILINHLIELLQAGAQAKAWCIEDPRLTAVFLFNGLHAAVDDAYISEKRVNRNRLTSRLRFLFLRSLGL
ncbi:MAG: TetR/AcrR family transcriptional regulator [Candidatus Acidiferrum sp.]